MAGCGDGLSMNVAGMSKNQLYDIMSQMKTLIEQNGDQARQILIQNPLLTKALFQAQIMLGMLQPPQEIPNIQPASSQHPQQAAPPAQLPNAQTPSLPGQSSLRDQTTAPMPSSTPAQQSNPSLTSHPVQPIQPNRGSHINAQSAPMPSPQSSQLPHHYSTQQPSVAQPTMPTAPAPISNPGQQQPLHMNNMPHMPLQPPLPPQPRPPSMPAFPHQNYSHMGPNAGYQHPSAPQMHHSQPMFHSGSRPPASMAPPFSQGQPQLPNQQLSQASYQGGSSHVGMDYNQMGIPAQPERPNWMPGLSENAAGPSPPFLPAHMGSGSQPPRPTSLTADMEKVLLQQVMSLTPEQINLLPPDQRNQVLHLQQMLRQDKR